MLHSHKWLVASALDSEVRILTDGKDWDSNIMPSRLSWSKSLLENASQTSICRELALGCVAQLVGHPAPEGCWLNFRPGHLPEFWVQLPVGGMQETSD